MKAPMNEDQAPHDRPDDEYVPEDDAIIGVYFRRSLLVAVVLAALGAAAYFLASRPPEQPPEVAIEAAAPEAVAREVTPPEVRFADVTREAGIDFVHWNGAEGEKLLPETMGSGSAFLDYDNDGDQDLLLVNSASWPHSASGKSAATALYRNDGRGRFEDVSRESGIDLAAYATGVAVGDVDNDGWVDVFFTAVGPNHLFMNRRGRFEEATAAAGVAGEEAEWSTSAGFFDADRDGDLDLFVCNYVRWSRAIDQQVDYRLTGVGRAYGPPVNYEGTFPYFYPNRGDGTFADASQASGVRVRNDVTGVPVAKALGLAPVDVDGDGWIDVLVANDTVRNFFFHNRGIGADGVVTFQETAELYGLAYGREGEATGAMGIDSAHFRNDADLGFAIGNFANEMTSLYITQGEATLFADEAITEGIGAPSRTMLSFGVLFFDYDLDGREDVLQANGHLETEIGAVDPSQTYEQAPQLFWNAGPGQRQGFVAVDLAAAGDLARPLVGRGGSFADVDGDGDLDVVLTQAGRAAVLLANEQRLGHHWLRLRLVDPGSQRDAIGAWVELTAGGVTQRRQVMPTRGYQSQSELPVTFGLGENDAVEALTVTWPDGTVQELGDLELDRLHVIEKGA